jgi:hypothetical protein
MKNKTKKGRAKPALTMSADALWTKWKADGESVYNELVETFALRRQFRDFFDLFKGSPRLQETGGHVWRWLLVCYTNTILVRIRRHVEGQSNEASLYQLLEDIKSLPDVPTQSRVIGERRGESDYLYERLVENYAERWTGGIVGGPFVPSVIDEDIRQLKAACKVVTRAANTQFIHLQRAVPPSALRIDDVDEALDQIEEVFKRYHTLLLNASLYGLEPVPQFNTHEVFTFPWWTPPTVDEWLKRRDEGKP